MFYYESIVISDIHLGSKVCQSKQLIKFLHQILDGEIIVENLIINGDLFDSLDFRRLCKEQWKILSLLRKLSKKIKILLILGNHDGEIDFLSNLIGMEIYEELIIASGGKNILVLHGDRFDNYITKYPTLTYFVDKIYRLLQKLHIGFAIKIKQNSKTFLRCSEKIKFEAINYIKEKNCELGCFGHTHKAEEELIYFNSGCWTEEQCSYLTIKDGKIKLNFFQFQEKTDTP